MRAKVMVMGMITEVEAAYLGALVLFALASLLIG